MLAKLCDSSSRLSELGLARAGLRESRGLEARSETDFDVLLERDVEVDDLLRTRIESLLVGEMSVVVWTGEDGRETEEVELARGARAGGGER